MNIDRARLAILLAAALAPLAGGCAMDPNTGQLVATPPELGEASRQTMLAQVIDPEPEYDSLIAVSSGDHAQQAIDRYNTDAVKEPKVERVGRSGSGGGGGAGGSGGTPGS